MYKLQYKHASEQYWHTLAADRSTDILLGQKNVHDDCHPGQYDYRIIPTPSGMPGLTA
jgi:hypothetical protein